ncbi:unnamed protein product [Spirodela intermedia]|uniref:Uncharacterized protein n=1 Tax=Spirodela intermedia TaxID=51605 RepID=A0A7I8JTQ1_SPIIN|nr:unnamed protein product [Spirodela intermedia]CAA6673469.1 unnamed protein product [Spirodela intermedia]
MNPPMGAGDPKDFFPQRWEILTVRDGRRSVPARFGQSVPAGRCLAGQPGPPGAGSPLFYFPSPGRKQDSLSPDGGGLGIGASLREKLSRALCWIRDSYRDCEVLIQVWLPTEGAEGLVLTTSCEPFALAPGFLRRGELRVAHGLPGRVFLGKLPEWSPDVRYFSNYEYPRVNYAQQCDVRGSLALPIFHPHRGGGGGGPASCLGVIEVVMTTERINYRSDYEHICSALQAVDLSSSEVLNAPRVEARSDFRLAGLPEIAAALRTSCRAHGFALAQAWIPCAQQGRSGSRHSDGNYEDCVSTVDALCYVNDPVLAGFHEACSEHHLLRGQGIVGKAFSMNRPWFSSDITAPSKTEYPLSHHARMLGLGAAVAVCLHRGAATGKAEIVLEFIFPKDSRRREEQAAMVNAMLFTLRQACPSWRILAARELEEESLLQVNPQQASASSENAQELTKTEKTISLEVLRQHFSGSLKEAAKVLGVCPTTLKRICRQHGITRWPARKIKKVGHSLRKLQVVIDSVQGIDGAVHLSPLYDDVRRAPGQAEEEAGKKNVITSLYRSDDPELSSTPNPPSSHSQTSCTSGSSRGCSRGQEQCTSVFDGPSEEAPFVEENGGTMMRSSDELEKDYPTEGTPATGDRLKISDSLGDHSDPKTLFQNGARGLPRVKAMLGEDKIRFSLKPNWGVYEVMQEISKRFNISDINSMDLRYLDDESEWVLLRCDDDLKDCADLYRTSRIHTIKISVHHADRPSFIPFGSEDSDHLGY